MKGLNKSRGRAGHGRPGFPAVAVLAALLWCLAAPLLAADLPVSGVVRDADGVPVAGARVSLHPLPDRKPAMDPGGGAAPEGEPLSESRPPPVAVTNSGEDGTYSIVAPQEGFWTLVAQSEGRELAEARLWPLLEPAHIALTEPWRRPEPSLPGEPRPLDSAAAPSSGPRWLVGRVVSRPSAAMLAGAWVWPLDDPSRAVVTSEDGWFVFSVPSESGWGLGFAARGHRGTTRDWPAEAEGGGSFVYLQTQFTLVGTVEDWRGRPVAGAEIRVYPAGRSWPDYLDWRNQGYSGARSGPDGRFTVYGLDPQYELTAVAVHPEHPPAAVEIDKPGSFRATPGHPVPIRLTLPRGGRVRGTVVDDAGRPLAGAEITLASQELQGGSPYLEPVMPGAITAVAEANGAFRITGVPAGPAALAIEAPGRATRVIADLDVPMGTLDLGALELGDEATVSGRVIDTRGEPVVGVGVDVFYSAGDLKRRPDERRLAFRRFTLPPTDGAGGFRVEGIEPGTQVSLHVDVEAFFPQAMYAVAPADAPVELVLTRVARLEGRVIDESGRPVARAYVGARFAEGPGGQTTDSARTDEEGRFVLGRLAEGEVELDMGLGAHLLPTPERVRVAAGETVRGVELRVTTGLAVSGRVLDSKGEPIRLARVDCHPCSGVASDQADFDGLYSIQGLRPGRITLYAGQDGYVGTRAETEVGPGDVTLDLVLERGVVVSGRVLRATGEPAGRVVVALTGEPDDPSRFLQNGSVRNLTEPDGSFELPSIPDGTYRFVLSAPEEPLTETVAWRLELPDPLTVAGAPVPDLAIRLPQFAAIRGQILGLSPEEFPYVHVVATVAGPGAPGYLAFGRFGTVGAEGSFELLDLLAGRYEVAAGLPDGRRASAEVEVLEGEPEVRLDLAFDP